MALTFKFSLWHLFYATFFVAVMTAVSTRAYTMVKENDYFRSPPTQVEVKLKRQKEALERLEKERLKNAQGNDDS